jgi:hypothetical protein
MDRHKAVYNRRDNQTKERQGRRYMITRRKALSMAVLMLIPACGVDVSGMRKVYLVEDDFEIPIRMKDLKDGDKFRMYEPDGKMVEDPGGNYIWTAHGDAFMSEENSWAIRVS